MKGCVLFLGGIIQVGIRTSNYLNDKDTLASLYYDNDSDVYSPKMTATVVIVMTMIKKSQLLEEKVLDFVMAEHCSKFFDQLSCCCLILQKIIWKVCIGVDLAVWVTVVVSLKWLPVPIMTSQSKTTTTRRRTRTTRTRRRRRTMSL